MCSNYLGIRPSVRPYTGFFVGKRFYFNSNELKQSWTQRIETKNFTACVRSVGLAIVRVFCCIFFPFRCSPFLSFSYLIRRLSTCPEPDVLGCFEFLAHSCVSDGFFMFGAAVIFHLEFIDLYGLRIRSIGWTITFCNLLVSIFRWLPYQIASTPILTYGKRRKFIICWSFWREIGRNEQKQRKKLHEIFAAKTFFSAKLHQHTNGEKNTPIGHASNTKIWSF